MSKDRLMINVQELLVSVDNLTAEEVGAFMHLAMYYHENGQVPSDIRVAQNIARSYGGTHFRKKIWPRIAHMFVSDGDNLRIPLLDKWIADRARRVSDIPAGQWQRMRRNVFERDNYTCSYCGTAELTQPDCDHIIPIIQGGMSTLENLATSCRTCNVRKGGRTPEEWLQ